jgi:hypothetical protein
MAADTDGAPASVPPFSFDAAADGVAVRLDPSKGGRCLIATRDFAPGEVVLRQRPYAYALTTAAAACYCDFCHRPLSPSGPSAAAEATTTALATRQQQHNHPPILRCSRCKIPAYCDQACQRSAWVAWHREECAALTAVAPRIPPLTLRLAARALWRRRREEAKGNASSSSSAWRDGGTWAEVEALRDGWADGGAAADHQQLPLPPARKVLLAQMGALLARLYSAGCGGSSDPSSSAPSFPIKEAALLLSRVALNAHALAACEGQSEPHGAALAPRCALLNHSSRPNAFQRFTRGSGGAGGRASPLEAVFVAIRPVRQGDELTVAYVDVSGGGGAVASSPLAVRRALRQGYLFDPRPEERDGGEDGRLAAALPLELGAVVSAGGGEEHEGKLEVRVLALRGEAGAQASEAARRDPRAAALTALGGGPLEGGVDVSFVVGEDSGGAEDELMALLEGGPHGGGGSGAATSSNTSNTPAQPASVVSAVGWGPWAERDDTTRALAALARRFARAERLRARAEAEAASPSSSGPRAAARTLTAALRLLEEGDEESSSNNSTLVLRLAPTQPLPMALRAALSDALFSSAVLHSSPADQEAAWREARDGALAMERTAPTGWPALGLRLARAASLALRVAQDQEEEEGGAQERCRETAAEGAALASRALGILKASHGSGWGQGAAWIVRNQAAALDELRHMATIRGA